MNFETYGLYYLVAINVFTFLMFGWDKWMAQGSARGMARGQAWRTPEKVLWILSLMGGSLGAIAGMQTFRHKTRKVSFQFILVLIIIVQVLLLAAWYYYNDQIS